MYCSRLVMMCCLLLTAAVRADEPQWPLLRICEDESGWAPFSFAREDGDGANHLQGFSIDVWNSLQLPVAKTELHAMPWLRCLTEVERGKDYQLSLSASIKPDRIGRFLFSDPYYSTQLHYFFDPRRFPSNIEFSSQTQLSHYRVCGVAGYQYRGIDTQTLPIDQGARDLAALFKLLELGRCDFVLSAIEVARGKVLSESPRLLQPPLMSRPMPDVPPEHYHMLVSTQLPNAEQLVRLIDEGLERLQQSGEMQRLRQRWNLPDETASTD